MPNNERNTLATAVMAAVVAGVVVQAHPDLADTVTVAVTVFLAMLAYLRLS